MTAQATRPYPPATPAARDGFAQLVRAEWTKLRTVRGWVIGLVITALVMAGLGLLIGGGSSSSCQQAGSSGPGRSGPSCGGSAFTVGPAGEPVNDSFYFVRQPLTGNGSLTVRVTSLTGLLPSTNPNAVSPNGPVDTRPGLVPWAKAGVIIKESTRPGSAYAAMMVTADHGVRLQDNYTSDTAGQAGAVSPASPHWLRLTRSGDAITGYDSADGTHWTQVGTVHLSGLSRTVQAGLFATSPAYAAISSNFGGGTSGMIAPSQATGVFDHVSRSGGWHAGPWTGEYIDAGGGSGRGGYHQAGGRFTVTGSGDISPVIAGSDTNPGQTLTISNLLVGTFAGLIGVLVVGAMFITAEYRRGLIRTTLAASPRRGRVLAAKAVVIGSVTFVTGLAAAAAAVIVGGQVARDRGVYVFPATWTTELRVVGGTAALLAVAAVLALALGAVLRRGVAAVTLVVVTIVLPYLLAVTSVLPVGVLDWLLRLTPAAAFAVEQAAPQYPQVLAVYSTGTGYFPLAPWAGLAVLCGWAALVMGLAVVLIRRRDV